MTGHHYTIVPVERLIPMRPDSDFLRVSNHILRIITRLMPGLFAYEIVLECENQVPPKVA